MLRHLQPSPFVTDEIDEEIECDDEFYDNDEEQEEYEDDLFVDNQPMRVIHRLYIGSIDAARNAEALRLQDIGFVLTAGHGLKPDFADPVSSLVVEVEDYGTENIGCHLTRCVDYIHKGRHSAGVLVHCLAGRSRSAAIVMAYLMTHSNLNVAEALAVVQNVRPWARPNNGFMQQLQAYEQWLRQSPAAPGPGRDLGQASVGCGFGSTPQAQERGFGFTTQHSGFAATTTTTTTAHAHDGSSGSSGGGGRTPQPHTPVHDPFARSCSALSDTCCFADECGTGGGGGGGGAHEAMFWPGTPGYSEIPEIPTTPATPATPASQFSYSFTPSKIS